MLHRLLPPPGGPAAGSPILDGGLTAVAVGCPNLKHLDLNWCPNVMDGGLTAVAAGCPDLKHHHLSHCSNVTDGIVAPFLKVTTGAV